MRHIVVALVAATGMAALVAASPPTGGQSPAIVARSGTAMASLLDSAPSQQCFGQSPANSGDTPNCTSFNPQVTVGQYGGSTTCTFTTIVTWGDGSAADTQVYPGQPNNALDALFQHTYSALGTYAVTISRSANSPCSGSETFNWTFTYVGPGSPPIFTSDTPPPDATIETPYSYAFAATGNPAPSFIVVSGSLPPGISLDAATGVLTGLPTADGVFTFQVAAANGISPAAVTPPITVTVGLSCSTISTAAGRVVCIAEQLLPGYPYPRWSGGRIPYSWGGGHDPHPPGPSRGICRWYGGPHAKTCSTWPRGPTHTVGLDCSGFTRWVYDLAYGRDVLGGGNADSQRTHRGVHPDKGMVPALGDLVFYKNKKGVWMHVGILVVLGEIINEANTLSFLESDEVKRFGTPYYYIYAGRRLARASLVASGPRA